jgi:hypothetical protein
MSHFVVHTRSSDAFFFQFRRIAIRKNIVKSIYLYIIVNLANIMI